LGVLCGLDPLGRSRVMRVWSEDELPRRPTADGGSADSLEDSVGDCEVESRWFAGAPPTRALVPATPRVDRRAPKGAPHSRQSRRRLRAPSNIDAS